MYPSFHYGMSLYCPSCYCYRSTGIRPMIVRRSCRSLDCSPASPDLESKGQIQGQQHTANDWARPRYRWTRANGGRLWRRLGLGSSLDASRESMLLLYLTYFKLKISSFCLYTFYNLSFCFRLCLSTKTQSFVDFFFFFCALLPTPFAGGWWRWTRYDGPQEREET